MRAAIPNSVKRTSNRYKSRIITRSSFLPTNSHLRPSRMPTITAVLKKTKFSLTSLPTMAPKSISVYQLGSAKMILNRLIIEIAPSMTSALATITVMSRLTSYTTEISSNLPLNGPNRSTQVKSALMEGPLTILMTSPSMK